MVIDTVEAFLVMEEMLILNQSFAETERFINFAQLRREFEERELLDELNREDDLTRNEPSHSFGIIS